MIFWPNGDPRDVARAIAAEPRFHGLTASAPPGPGLLERALEWIGDRLRDFVAGAGHALGDSAAFGTLAILGLAAAVTVALIVLVERCRGLPGRRHVARPRAVPLEDLPASSQLFAQALRFARAERWQDAASALARAALLALDERGRLRFDGSRTLAEARFSLRDPGFDAFEREATAALFAEGEATAERFARLRDAYGQTFGTPS